MTWILRICNELFLCLKLQANCEDWETGYELISISFGLVKKKLQTHQVENNPDSEESRCWATQLLIPLPGKDSPGIGVLRPVQLCSLDEFLAHIPAAKRTTVKHDTGFGLRV